MGVELAWTVDVVDVSAAPGEETEILLAPDGRTDAISHGVLPVFDGFLFAHR